MYQKKGIMMHKRVESEVRRLIHRKLKSLTQDLRDFIEAQGLDDEEEAEVLDYVDNYLYDRYKP